MSWDTNLANDYSTGLDVLDREDLIERVEFWGTHNDRDYDAEVRFSGVDDYELDVLLDGNVVARFDNDIDGFEDWMREKCEN